MMACSYLSAGGMKSDQTSAACWSPPAMAGSLATETRPILPIGLVGLQSSLAGLPSGSMGLPRESIPRGLMAIPSRALPSEQLGLPSGPVGLPCRPMGLACGPLGTANKLARSSGKVGLPIGSVGSSVLPNAQMGLPPPFVRHLPMDLHSVMPQPESSASEPALDLSTSSVTSSLKPQLPSPTE